MHVHTRAHQNAASPPSGGGTGRYPPSTRPRYTAAPRTTAVSEPERASVGRRQARTCAISRGPAAPARRRAASSSASQADSSRRAAAPSASCHARAPARPVAGACRSRGPPCSSASSAATNGPPPLPSRAPMARASWSVRSSARSRRAGNRDSSAACREPGVGLARDARRRGGRPPSPRARASRPGRATRPPLRDRRTRRTSAPRPPGRTRRSRARAGCRRVGRCSAPVARAEDRPAGRARARARARPRARRMAGAMVTGGPAPRAGRCGPRTGGRNRPATRR